LSGAAEERTEKERFCRRMITSPRLELDFHNVRHRPDQPVEQGRSTFATCLIFGGQLKA
jgi:hypothetical protein